MAASTTVARLAMQAARLCQDARAMRANLDAYPAAYPTAWAEEEETVRAEAVSFHLDALWRDRRAVRSILSRVREETCCRMIAPPAATREEWRTSVPAHYLHAHGVPADDVADCLGYAGEDELRAAIVAEVGTLARRKADLMPAAIAAADGEPAARAFAARRDDWEAAQNGRDVREAVYRDMEAAANQAHDALAAAFGPGVAEVAIAAAMIAQNVGDVAIMVAAYVGECLADLAGDIDGRADTATAPVARTRKARRQPAAMVRFTRRGAGILAATADTLAVGLARLSRRIDGWAT